MDQAGSCARRKCFTAAPYSWPHCRIAAPQTQHTIQSSSYSEHPLPALPDRTAHLPPRWAASSVGGGRQFCAHDLPSHFKTVLPFTQQPLLHCSSVTVALPSGTLSSLQMVACKARRGQANFEMSCRPHHVSPACAHAIWVRPQISMLKVLLRRAPAARWQPPCQDDLLEGIMLSCPSYMGPDAAAARGQPCHCAAHAAAAAGLPSDAVPQSPAPGRDPLPHGPWAHAQHQVQPSSACQHR